MDSVRTAIRLGADEVYLVYNVFKSALSQQPTMQKVLPVEAKDFITGEWSLVALAGPANRQGRIAADVIPGRDSHFRGTQGTSIVGVFGGAAAWTGVSEKMLKWLGETDYEKIYLYPNSHAGYYPGAQYLAMKIIFRKSDGRLLGAQAVGLDGVDKRIDVLATAIRPGMTVLDLEHLELAYAPPYGSAKDPVNMIGFLASNTLQEDLELWYAFDYPEAVEGATILDVRTPEEYQIWHIPGAVNVPHAGNLTERGTFRSREELRARYAAAGITDAVGSIGDMVNSVEKIRTSAECAAAAIGGLSQTSEEIGTFVAVIDEIAGMVVTYLGVATGPLGWLAGFFWFRLFDILKPWPIRSVEKRFGGGLGIMLDDVVAALFAMALLQGAAYLLQSV